MRDFRLQALPSRQSKHSAVDNDPNRRWTAPLRSFCEKPLLTLHDQSLNCASVAEVDLKLIPMVGLRNL